MGHSALRSTRIGLTFDSSTRQSERCRDVVHNSYSKRSSKNVVNRTVTNVKSFV